MAPQHQLVTVNVGTFGSTLLFPVTYEANQVPAWLPALLSLLLRGERPILTCALLKPHQVLAATGKKLLDGSDRGQAVKDMHDAAPIFIRNLHCVSPFQGIVGLGGSGAC